MFSNEQLLVETPRLKKFALRLTGNAPDADDLLQTTLLRAMEKARLFRKDSNLWSWLSKMMYNLFVSDYRRAVKFHSQFDPQDAIDRLCDDGDQEDNADVRLVGRAMEQLSPQRREILILVCVQGLSYEEAAEKLGIPDGTVRSRLSRARSELLSLLEAREHQARLELSREEYAVAA